MFNIFIDRGREARLFLLLATFLWAGILIGPSNIYFLLLAIGLSIRGLFMLIGWYQKNTEIKVYIDNIYEFHLQNFDETNVKNFKYKYESFFADSLMQFGIILSVYPISLIAYYAEKNNLETLQTITYIIVAILLMGVMGMGTTNIEDFSKDQ